MQVQVRVRVRVVRAGARVAPAAARDKTTVVVMRGQEKSQQRRATQTGERGMATSPAR